MSVHGGTSSLTERMVCGGFILGVCGVFLGCAFIVDAVKDDADHIEHNDRSNQNDCQMIPGAA